MNSVFRVRVSCRESLREGRGSRGTQVQSLEMLRLAIMFMKTNELSVFEGSALIAYLLENKPDNSRLESGSQKTPGGKNEGFSHYVIENK